MQLFQVLIVALAAYSNCNEVSNLFFAENFDENVFETGKWVKSAMSKYSDQKVLIAPSLIATNGFENDKGLRLADDMKHYGIGTKFPIPFTVKDDPKQGLVIQYGKFNCLMKYSIYYAYYRG